MIRKAAHLTYKTARRIVILAVGSTIVVLGIVMLITPGPGLVVIPLGLAVLGAEFAWARIWLRKLRETISNTSSRNHAKRAQRHRESAGR